MCATYGAHRIDTNRGSTMITREDIGKNLDLQVVTNPTWLTNEWVGRFTLGARCIVIEGDSSVDAVSLVVEDIKLHMYGEIIDHLNELYSMIHNGTSERVVRRELNTLIDMVSA